MKVLDFLLVTGILYLVGCFIAADIFFLFNIVGENGVFSRIGFLAVSVVTLQLYQLI